MNFRMDGSTATIHGIASPVFHSHYIAVFIVGIICGWILSDLSVPLYNRIVGKNE